MRTERLPFSECDSLATAWEKCPWAANIVETDNSYTAFESLTDYEMWAQQD